ncbi:hypothetical protein M409DRAFT_48624 [Zasmidium cellare ATCC 36951]|uniref:DUF6604 domain-containing protein n=1 Tax=Zasmidium cellare ATCC 36951 TaxID=1080233 RepID=A0A6A6D2R4_ZASCE|nr:uncharacterized protein M409DRAFT_48624 [Zasmidium cellare ATCC 36951]KAF2173684.1 hypothetical protein M409DRAFT_48624 [Zasmidium cellare ATCC 36951]
MSAEAGLDPIVNRYVRYKAGTKQVVQWLASTASLHCDIKEYLHCLKLDSSRSMCAPTQSRVQVKTRELLDLTNIIVTAEPPIQIPIEILVVLEDVIALRRASADWYSTQPTSKADNDGHSFFVEILQQIQALLASAKGAPNGTDGHAASTSRKRKSQKFKDDLSNLFECLELEEPSEAPLGNVSSTHTPRKQFECGDFSDDEEDEAFALWCYIEDANDTRKFVRKMWFDYRDGELSLAVAGMVTECAFDLLQHAHIGFVENFPSLNDWPSLMAHLGLQWIANQNVAYVYPASSAITKKLPPTHFNTSDLLCSSAALQLMAYAKASDNFRRSILTNHGDIFKASTGDVTLDRPITAFEKPLFATIRELISLTSPAATGGQAVGFCPTTMTLGLIEACCSLQGSRRTEVPLWLVFGTAICMDIAEVVETNVDCPGDAVLDSVAYVERTIDHRFKFHERPEKLRFEPMEPENRKQWQKVLDLTSILKAAITKGRKLSDPAQRLSNRGKMACHLAKCKFPLLDSLPHYAGEMEYILKIHLHDISVYAANESWTILCLAHIYRAARFYGLIEAHWQDLDMVIAHQSSRKPFITKTNAHSDAYTMLRHFLIDLGVERSVLSKPGLPGPPDNKTVQAKSKQLSPGESGYRAAVIERYKADEKIGVYRTDFVEIFLTSLTEKSDNTSRSTHNSAKQIPQKFAPSQLLSTMKSELVSDEPCLNFDYSSFTCFCADTIIQMFLAALFAVPTQPPSSYRSSYQLTYFLMKEAADAQTQSKPIHTTAFARAAKVLEHILKEGDKAKKFSTAAFNMSSGRIPKASWPQFPAQRDVDPAVAKLQECYPVTTIGTLRKTIEMYDPNGSAEAFESMMNTSAMQDLLPEDQGSQDVEGSMTDSELRDLLFSPEILSRFSHVFIVGED